MGVPDVNARKKIRGLQITANYLIDNNSVKLGCCDWWTKRSKRVGTLELDRIRKSMSVIVREPDGHNQLLVKVYLLISLYVSMVSRKDIVLTCFLGLKLNHPLSWTKTKR
ncbi:putative P-type Ca(2+) transporter [Helianthus annuus]|uniref:Calcium-transporting ATPase n=1 Tax=Helianthus annuus TaxID=4232 RepID=A0A9K3NTW9_HELAN|nr:putative calcium-transporting ATPase [Helianthus annuus]KAJ0606344.1 putative P-type Ca(2+) transporter [Helianthus annuus]KAJ0766436.1 putative P-type Ca(2+) transporter [Helianthus annuus]KAJ0933636.1 putative P-type Ca(2+) transporter [Helianthus annuus]